MLTASYSAMQVLQTENTALHRERPALTPRPTREWGNLKDLLLDERVGTDSSASCSVLSEHRLWWDRIE